MSHICIIQGNNRSQAMGCYHHVLNRQLYHFITLIEVTDNVLHFLETNQIHVLVVEDSQAFEIITLLDLAAVHISVDVLVVGSGDFCSKHHNIHMIAKQKRVTSLLFVIDFIAMQAHLKRSVLNKDIALATYNRIYESIRFIEYSHNHVFFHLAEITFRFPYSMYQMMSFEDSRFITINPSMIVNIDALVKFEQHSVTLDRGEKITISEEFRDECWDAICRFTLSKHQFRFLSSSPHVKKRISRFSFLKE